MRAKEGGKGRSRHRFASLPSRSHGPLRFVTSHSQFSPEDEADDPCMTKTVLMDITGKPRHTSYIWLSFNPITRTKSNLSCYFTITFIPFYTLDAKLMKTWQELSTLWSTFFYHSVEEPLWGWFTHWPVHFLMMLYIQNASQLKLLISSRFSGADLFNQEPDRQ